MTLHISERECPAAEHAHDHVAEASILGTAIVSFDRSAGAADPAPLTIMRLNPLSPVPAELQLPTPKEAQQDAGLEEPVATPEGGRLDRYVAARSAKRASRSILSYSDSSSVSKDD